MRNPFILTLFFYLFLSLSREGFAQQSAPAFQAGGSIRVSTILYHVDGIPNRRAPLSIIASGAPYVEIFGNRVPLQFTVSNFRSRFHQPFNQFGISPQYKWIKMHLGFRNLQFSQFTLGGARLLGVGAELTPGKWYMAGAYGRFQAARFPGVADQAIIPGLYTIGAVYERTGYSFKMGFGQQHNYFHLIFLRASDDGTSLTAEETIKLPPVQENSIFGFNTGFRFLKYFQWRAEAALSAWTLNTESPLTRNVPSVVNWFYVPRASSQYLTAGESTLEFRHKGYMVGGKYRRVDPDYKSMGMYFVQADLEEFSGNVALPLGKGKYFFNGSFGTQRDNLYGLKSVTSRRLIYNALTTLQLSKWLQLTGMYSNFGMTQSPVQATISDTMLLDQVLRNLMLGANFQFRSPGYHHTFRLQYMEQGLSDLRADIFGMAQLNSSIYSIQYTLGIPSKKMNAGIGLQRMDSFLGFDRIGNIGIQSNFTQRLSYKQMSVNAQASVFANQLNNEANGSTLSLGGGGDWPIQKNLRLSLQCQWLSNQAIQEGPVRSFREWTLRTSFQYTFTSKKRTS